MTLASSAYSRFQRALTTGNLQLIAAVALPKVSLEDALAILIVLAQLEDPRFERAAARWVGRLLTETPADLTTPGLRWRLLSGCRAVAMLFMDLPVGAETAPDRGARQDAERGRSEPPPEPAVAPVPPSANLPSIMVCERGRSDEVGEVAAWLHQGSAVVWQTEPEDSC